MITPRQTRLHRVQTLHDVQRVLWSLVDDRDPFVARSSVVLVPSRAAAAALRHTLETLACRAAGDSGADVVLTLPDLATRTEWYEQLYERLAEAPPLVNEFEREVMMGAAARQAAEAGAAPPFRLRPGIVTEIVRLYDELRRLRKGVADFERLMTADLEGDADTDRGAGRLLEQTRFLAGAFRGYEARLACPPRFDEHRLREWLLDHPSRLPYTHVVVAMADRASEPGGLWPADFDLLTRLPGSTTIDVVATEGILAAGFHERVHELLPGIEERRGDTVAGGERGPGEAGPVLVAPAEQAELHFKSRDREEELASIARALKEPRADRTLGRTAIVFRRPLPYIYLARLVFDAAGIPHQTHDALPLAAEPYAAALDLVLECVSSDFGRAPAGGAAEVPAFRVRERSPRRPAAPCRPSIAGLETSAISPVSTIAGAVERWSAPVPGVAGRSRAAHGVVRTVQAMTDELAPRSPKRPPLRSISTACRRSCGGTTHPLAIGDPLRERQLRARAAIHAALVLLGDACRGDRRSDGRGSSSCRRSVRRWIEGQTFAPRAGRRRADGGRARRRASANSTRCSWSGSSTASGRDAYAAQHLLPGVPARVSSAGPTSATRAGRRARRVRRPAAPGARHDSSVSTFTLEDDAIVGPSSFLDDVRELRRIVGQQRPTRPRSRIFADEALAAGDAVAPVRARRRRPQPGWPLRAVASAGRRSARSTAQAGRAAPRTYAVSALETLLECPFKFFAERRAAASRGTRRRGDAATPRERGQFVHEVFETFFDAWAGSGRRRDHAGERCDEARTLFADGRASRCSRDCPEAEAPLERTRLLGIAGRRPASAESVFRDRGRASAPTVARAAARVPLEGEFAFERADGRRTCRAAREGRSDRPARRRHASRHRLQVGRAAEPRSGAAGADLRAVRRASARRAGTAQPGESARRPTSPSAGRGRFVPLGQAGGSQATTALADARSARARDAVDGIDARRVSARPPAERFLLHVLRVRRRVPEGLRR